MLQKQCKPIKFIFIIYFLVWHSKVERKRCIEDLLKLTLEQTPNSVFKRRITSYKNGHGIQ
jgi:hypothetical protein